MDLMFVTLATLVYRILAKEWIIGSGDHAQSALDHLSFALRLM
jgi:hypothetical protein